MTSLVCRGSTLLVSRGSSVLSCPSPAQQAQWQPLNLGDYKVGWLRILLTLFLQCWGPGLKVRHGGLRMKSGNLDTKTAFLTRTERKDCQLLFF
jgi:hypothetical protein